MPANRDGQGDCVNQKNVTCFVRRSGENENIANSNHPIRCQNQAPGFNSFSLQLFGIRKPLSVRPKSTSDHRTPDQR